MQSFNKNDTVLYNLRLLYEQYGYKRFKMSKFEEYDLYLEYKNFLQTENIITFTDLNGKLYAMKPDITLSIAKNANPEEPQKLYYKENVYRASRTTKEYKEITQLGVEYIGRVDAYTMGEAVYLAAKSLSLISDEYVLDISHMGFVSGLFEAAGIDGNRMEKLLGFLGQKDTHEILFCCEQYGIEKEIADKIASLSEIYGSFENTLPKIKALAVNDKMAAAVNELEELYAILSTLGVGEHVNLDFSIVNDMSYYNGVIYLGYVKDVPCSVLSGGRYDKLLEKLGKNCQAIGFAVYTDLIELYDKSDREYDVDVLIVYDEGVSPVEVSEKVAGYISSGKSVKVMSGIPEMLKYRELVKITEKGVQ